MLKTPQFMREMKRGEEPAVADLLTAAFGQKDEARRVEELRRTRAIAGEMVLPMDGEIIGYAALSKMISPQGWLCLGPVAIRPDLQARGYGRRLVGMISQWASMTGNTLVVLGEPGFYSRCGFAPIADGFTSPYPLSHTLTAGPAKTKIKVLSYPKAFG